MWETHRFVVAQFGARMHYAVPRIFHSAGRLERLYTEFAAVGPWSGFGRLPWRRLRSRAPEGIPADLISHFPMFGLGVALGQRMARSESAWLRFWIEMGRRFCAAIAARDFGDASAVYAFNSAALELFREALRRGLYCILEQTIAPRSIEERLMVEERAAWPGWEAGAGTGAWEFAAREAAEWECADLIVCGSRFVADSVRRAGGPAERCRVVPYGVDVPPLASRTGSRSPGLNVLFCGAAGLRKGVPYLLEAARRLSPRWFRIRLVGAARLPEVVRRGLARRCELTGAIPRPDVAAHYQWADVFVLPSICEGSATVCYEALAAGLPVITTPNAGSVVRDGVDGYVVPIRDAAAIARRLDLLASDPALLARLSANARERAREFTVARYAERLLAAVSEATQNHERFATIG